MDLSLWLHLRERLLTDAKALKRLNSGISAGGRIIQENISTCDVKALLGFLRNPAPCFTDCHSAPNALQELQKSHCPLLNPWIVRLYWCLAEA